MSTQPSQGSIQKMRSGKVKNTRVKNFGFDKTFFRAANFKRLLLFALHFSFFTFCAFAQQDEPYRQPQPDDAAPPPLSMISKAEKTSLDALTDVSERTKLSLEFMEARLKRAEDSYAQNTLDQMFSELGGFNGLINNTLDFLKKNDISRGKVLNNYKKLEISLRKFSPRIELIRRELPAKYEYWVRSLIKSVRVARSKAVEPLFGDSVLPNEKEN